MLDPVTRAAALLAIAYRSQARFVAACHAEVAALDGDPATEKAWRRVVNCLADLAAPSAPAERRLSRPPRSDGA